MTFRENEIGNFIQIFESSSDLIQSFDGCLGVQLMKDVSNTSSYFTLSKWDSEEHLNNYRTSELFKSTWAKVKPLFSESAQAWSLVNTNSE